MRPPQPPPGPWELRFADEAAWRPTPVPGCWDALGGPAMVRAGPVWYRTTLAAPALAPGERAWLHFGAVSYDCDVFVDGRLAGSHRGLWDAFPLEVTELLTPGRASELLLRVEKPAGLAIVTTLRLEGGHGHQPTGIASSPAAAYLLSCWVRYLGSAGA